MNNQVERDHTERTTSEKCGRPKKISSEFLGRIMNSFVSSTISTGGEGVKSMAIMSDRDIAEAIAQNYGYKISPDRIYLYRKENKIVNYDANGGKPKVSDEDLSRMMDEFTLTEAGSDMKIATHPDDEIAMALSKRYSMDLSGDIICRYRKRHGIEAGGGKPKVGDDDLSRMMEEFTLTETISGKKVATQPDAKIAVLLNERHGLDISDEIIRRFRKRNGIEAHGWKSKTAMIAGLMKKYVKDAEDAEHLVELLQPYAVGAVAREIRQHAKNADNPDIAEWIKQYVENLDHATKLAQQYIGLLRGRLTAPDEIVAARLMQETGILYTKYDVQKWRSQNHIAPFNQHGGSRIGAGKKPGSDITVRKSSGSKKRVFHKLTISNYDLVRWCSSAFEFKNGRYALIDQTLPQIGGLKSFNAAIHYVEAPADDYNDDNNDHNDPGTQDRRKRSGVKGQ